MKHRISPAKQKSVVARRIARRRVLLSDKKYEVMRLVTDVCGAPEREAGVFIFLWATLRVDDGYAPYVCVGPLCVKDPVQATKVANSIDGVSNSTYNVD